MSCLKSFLQFEWIGKLTIASLLLLLTINNVLVWTPILLSNSFAIGNKKINNRQQRRELWKLILDNKSVIPYEGNILTILPQGIFSQP